MRAAADRENGMSEQTRDMIRSEAPAATRAASVPSWPPAASTLPSASRSLGGWLVAAGLIGVKLVKRVKFIKFALFVASLGALALNRPLTAACAILYAIFVHESGHVLAMKACGMRTSGMYF